MGKCTCGRTVSKAEHPGAAPEIVRNKELQRGANPSGGGQSLTQQVTAQTWASLGFRAVSGKLVKGVLMWGMV